MRSQRMSSVSKNGEGATLAHPQSKTASIVIQHCGVFREDADVFPFAFEEAGEEECGEDNDVACGADPGANGAEMQGEGERHGEGKKEEVVEEEGDDGHPPGVTGAAERAH